MRGAAQSSFGDFRLIFNSLRIVGIAIYDDECNVAADTLVREEVW